MKDLRSLLAFVAMVVIAPSHAEVLTVYHGVHENIQSLSKKGAVWVKCPVCNDAMYNRLTQGLMKNGYVVVDKKASAQSTLVLESGITIPKDGKASYVYSNEAYGVGLPPIAPAIKAQSDLSSKDVNKTSPRGLSAGETSNLLQAANSFGGVSSYGEGVVVAIVGNIIASIIGKAIDDGKRVPGVANAHVRVFADDHNKRAFTVISAANTPETPEALIDAAMDAVLDGLVNGIKKDDSGSATVAAVRFERSAQVIPTPQQENQLKEQEEKKKATAAASSANTSNEEGASGVQ
ncbi:hypothetical protein [Thiobacter aerophilum]|uniref:Uncharacterized protein n=1 Tax=Thiobacter aerophilum TaxID=3121275 RepID=A0ABV0EJR9_9BURK